MPEFKNTEEIEKACEDMRHSLSVYRAILIRWLEGMFRWQHEDSGWQTGMLLDDLEGRKLDTLAAATFYPSQMECLLEKEIKSIVNAFNILDPYSYSVIPPMEWQTPPLFRKMGQYAKDLHGWYKRYIKPDLGAQAHDDKEQEIVTDAIHTMDSNIEEFDKFARALKRRIKVVTEEAVPLKVPDTEKVEAEPDTGENIRRKQDVSETAIESVLQAIGSGKMHDQEAIERESGCGIRTVGRAIKILKERRQVRKPPGGYYERIDKNVPNSDR